MLSRCSCCGEMIAGGHVVQSHGAFFCSPKCANAGVALRAPKMSRKEKRQAKLCTAEGCEAPAKHYMGDTDDIFTCDMGEYYE